jgi:hypothetical protein
LTGNDGEGAVGRGIWDWVVVAFKGEHVALLGPRLSGKTTLHGYILNSALSSPPEQNLAAEQTDWVRNTEFGLNIRKGLDVPGGEASYPDWRTQFERSSKIFYLFDAHRIRTEGDYTDRVRRDGKEIRAWGTKGKRVMMIGTHADVDPLVKELEPAKYHDQIADLDVVVAFRTRAKVRGFAVGSLTCSPDAVAMVKRALSSP